MDYEMQYGTQIDQFITDLHKEMMARLIIQLSTDDLLRVLKDFKNNWNFSIRGCSQSQWHPYWDLVTTGEWRVVDTVWTESGSWHSKDKPLFIDVEKHREWMAIKTQQDRDAYWKKHHGDKSDASCYDGLCDILPPGTHISENRRSPQNKYGLSEKCFDSDGYLADDCIGIEIKKQRNYNYSDCSNNAGMGPVIDPHSLYILQPACKTKKERREVVVEIFRDRLCSLLARRKMDDYFSKLIPQLAMKILNE